MENNIQENEKCSCKCNGSNRRNNPNPDSNLDPKLPFTLHNNNPDVSITVNKDLELKEDEVVLCLGAVQGSNNPIWVTVQLNTETTDANTYTDEVVGKLICLLFHKAAVQHGWVNLGRGEGE